MKNQLTDYQIRDLAPHTGAYEIEFARLAIAAHEAIQPDQDAEMAALRKALQSIAESSGDEGGCLYENRANIAIAKKALASR